MAESNLSLTYGDYRSAVADDRGYGLTPANWTTRQLDVIRRGLRDGLSVFYGCPVPPAQFTGGRAWSKHEWSFMRPWATLTLAGGTTSYTLPDGFAGLIGPFAHTSGNQYRPIPVVSDQLLMMHAQNTSTTGPPCEAAVFPMSSSGITGQRWQVRFWPTPDQAYAVSYRYHANSGELTAENPYPLGGQRHSQTIMAFCMAEAQRIADGSYGNHYQSAMMKLADSIQADRRMAMPDTLGHIGDPGVERGDPFEPVLIPGAITTVGGVTPD